MGNTWNFIMCAPQTPTPAAFEPIPQTNLEMIITIIPFCFQANLHILAKLISASCLQLKDDGYRSQLQRRGGLLTASLTVIIEVCFQQQATGVEIPSPTPPLKVPKPCVSSIAAGHLNWQHWPVIKSMKNSQVLEDCTIR